MANTTKALTHHTLAGKALRSGDTKKAAHHMGHAMNALRNDATAQTWATPDDADPDDAMESAQSPTGDLSMSGSGQATTQSHGKATQPTPKGRFFGQFPKAPSAAPPTPARRPSAPGAASPSIGKLSGLLAAMKATKRP